MPRLDLQRALLIDGLGACASALCLGVVLPALQDWIGMPVGVLYLLAGIAALFAVNAFVAWRFAGAHAGRWLTAVALANLTYCALTASLVVWQWARLTRWGVAYFAGEIAVIAILVGVEWRSATRRRERPSAPS